MTALLESLLLCWLYRFGDGYRIKLRMKEVRGNDSMKEFMRQNFPEATLNVSKVVGKVDVMSQCFHRRNISILWYIRYHLRLSNLLRCSDY